MAWPSGGPRTWVTSETVTSTIMNAHVRDALNAVLPLGAPILIPVAPTSVETTLESRWIEGNGVNVSRTTYATLFGLLSTTYGTGDGSTTFGIPDMHGRHLAGASRTGGHTDMTTLGATDGKSLANRRVKHTHAAPASTLDPTDANSGTFAWPLTANPADDGPSYMVYGTWYIKYTS